MPKKRPKLTKKGAFHQNWQILIQNIIQFKENSTDSVQKIIQFNSQGIIDTGRIGKVSKLDKKRGAFHQNWQILISLGVNF